MHEFHSTPATTLELAPAPLTQVSLAQIQLLQALQTSLECSELIRIFFKHIQPLMTISGIHYQLQSVDSPLAPLDIQLGRTTIHRCDYNLHMHDLALGNIVFSRTERWTASDLAYLENHLRYLLYPLHHALQLAQANALARIDGLTQVGNRIAFNEELTRAVDTAQRHPAPLSLIMLDLDYFKRVNDDYGHPMGDRVLREVAGAINAACRTSDTTFRYGGEEFALVLHNTGLEGAAIFAERLSRIISELRFATDRGEALSITASLGVAALNPRQTAAQLLAQADQALYNAKHQGRARIALAPQLVAVQ